MRRNRPKTYVRLCFYRGFEIKIVTKTKEFAVFDDSSVTFVSAKRDDALNWVDKYISENHWNHRTSSGEIRNSKERETLDQVKKREWSMQNPSKKRKAGEAYPW